MIKKIPLPATDVMLGMAALGNLFQPYSERVRLLCGAVSLILGTLIVIKIILYPGQFAGGMKNLIMTNVSGTFSVAIMLLAGYTKPFMGGNAVMIWYAGIRLHATFTVYFTARFMIRLRMQQVSVSHYIVYMGIAMASVTAPAFGKLVMGTATFWFGFAVALILLVLATHRCISFEQVPGPAQPLFCIYTAPINLCLAGYIQSIQSKLPRPVLFTMIFNSVVYIMMLIRTPAYLKMKFYPNYAVFTFPFVITAIGLKVAMVCLGGMGHPVPALSYTVVGEIVIASILTIYALMKCGMAVLERGH